MLKELPAEVCLQEGELPIFLVTTVQPKLIKRFSRAGISDPEELVGKVFLSLCQTKRVFRELDRRRLETLVLDLALIVTTRWFRELQQRNEVQLEAVEFLHLQNINRMLQVAVQRLSRS